MHHDQTPVPPRQRDGLLPGQRAAPPGPVDLTSMFVLHQAFRRDLARFRAFTDVETPPAGLRHAARRWGLFIEAVTHHHEGEDRGLWPTLEAVAAPEEVAVLRQMAAEHESLHDALDACTDAVKALSASGWTEERVHAHAQFDRLAGVLEAHLAREEEAALAIAQRYLRHEDWLRIEREHFQKGMSPRVLLALVPWVFDALPERVRLAVLVDGLPAAGLVWRLTHGRFERRERELFGRYADLVPSASPVVVPGPERARRRHPGLDAAVSLLARLGSGGRSTAGCAHRLDARPGHQLLGRRGRRSARGVWHDLGRPEGGRGRIGTPRRRPGTAGTRSWPCARPRARADRCATRPPGGAADRSPQRSGPRGIRLLPLRDPVGCGAGAVQRAATPALAGPPASRSGEQHADPVIGPGSAHSWGGLVRPWEHQPPHETDHLIAQRTIRPSQTSTSSGGLGRGWLRR